jgi:hypothetical protein
MTSILAWLDYNENERRRVREVIEAFREHDTRDELGIGAVRDAFSQLLFPGTSTIQTRARYFLLVPWVYRQLEKDRVPSAHAAAKARGWEIQLIGSLLKGEDTDGVIGKEAGRHLLRLPSVIYWNGLGEYRIRLFRGSIGEYHRSLDGLHQRLRSSARAESEELYERSTPNWDPGLPPPPPELFEQASIGLTGTEAAYLKERVTTTQKGTLLALLLEGEQLAEEIAYPWDYPRPLPPEVRSILDHARVFSEVMHGAALLYNLLLARKGYAAAMGDRFAEWADEYQERLDNWAAPMGSASPRLDAWDRSEFWRAVEKANPRVGPRARHFIDSWFQLALREPSAIAGAPEAAALVHRREQQLKGRLARLDNAHQLERWNGAAGTGRLNFRWPTARTLIRDIHEASADA